MTHTSTETPMLVELEERAAWLRLQIYQIEEKLKQSHAEFDRTTAPAEHFVGGRRPQDWDSFRIACMELSPAKNELDSLTQSIAEIRAAQNQ